MSSVNKLKTLKQADDLESIILKDKLNLIHKLYEMKTENPQLRKKKIVVAR